MKPLFTFTLRRPVTSELEWFKREPHIAGYGADDGKIVINPFCRLNEIERACVARNEAMRLFMRLLDLTPDVDLLPEQIAPFRGTAYEANHDALRQTIIARIASGDPSVIHPTERQIGFANAFASIFDRLASLACEENSDRGLLHFATNVGPRTRP